MFAAFLEGSKSVTKSSVWSSDQWGKHEKTYKLRLLVVLEIYCAKKMSLFRVAWGANGIDSESFTPLGK